LLLAVVELMVKNIVVVEGLVAYLLVMQALHLALLTL
jgi:hypothetical protein